jgi:hypothetical protein
MLIRSEAGKTPQVIVRFRNIDPVLGATIMIAALARAADTIISRARNQEAE